MNDKEKVWKKLTLGDMKYSERVREALRPEPDSRDVYDDEQREMIADLTDKLDGTYELSDLRTVVDARTYEPILVARIIKTGKPIL